MKAITWWVAPSQHVSFQSLCWISSCLFRFSPWAKTESFNLHCVLACALTLIYDKPVNIKGIFRKRTYIEIWGTSPLWLSINNFLNEFLSVNGSQSPGEIGSVQILTLWSKENDRAKMTNWAARTLGAGDVWGEESEFLSLLTTSVDSTANLCQLGVRTC